MTGGNAWTNREERQKKLQSVEAASIDWRVRIHGSDPNSPDCYDLLNSNLMLLS
jgi:hypothetical protein